MLRVPSRLPIVIQLTIIPSRFIRSLLIPKQTILSNISRDRYSSSNKNRTFDAARKETGNFLENSYLTQLIRRSINDAIFGMIWPGNVAISCMIVRLIPQIVVGSGSGLHYAMYRVSRILCVHICMQMCACVQSRFCIR